MVRLRLVGCWVCGNYCHSRLLLGGLILFWWCFSLFGANLFAWHCWLCSVPCLLWFLVLGWFVVLRWGFVCIVLALLLLWWLLFACVATLLI